MKKLLPLIVVVLTLFAGVRSADAQIFLGAGGAAATQFEGLGLQFGAGIQLPVLPLRLSGDYIMFFEKDDAGVTEKWNEFNINLGYQFVNQFSFSSYVFAGLNSATEEFGSLKTTEYGVNVGLGAEYSFGLLGWYSELKYTVSELDQFVFTTGLRLKFGI
jgi:hypothetical protein